MIIFILLNFNSSTGSLAISPKDLTFNAAERFNGPELFPTKKFEFFKANNVDKVFEQGLDTAIRRSKEISNEY